MEGPDLSKVKLGRSGGAPWSSLTLPRLIERDGLDLDRRAVVFEGEARTYGELRTASRRVANALVGLGVEELDRVAVLSANRLEYIEMELGIAAARAIMVPLDWRLRGRELAGRLRHCGARAILVEDALLGPILELRSSGELPDLRTVIAIDGGGGDLAYEEVVGSAPTGRPARPGVLEDPHEISYTAGPDGRAKGVVWTNGGVLWNSIQQVMDFGLTAADSTYAVVDLHYIAGRHDFTWPILQQGGTVHVKRSRGFDGAQILEYIAEHGISHVLWVPTMLFAILRLPEVEQIDTSCLRTIICGGQPISAKVTRRAQSAFPHSDFIQVYGTPEAGGSLTFVTPAQARERPGSAGRPSMHVEMRLVDAEGVDVPAGVRGEILVRAPSVTAGYWDDPDATERQFVDGWLRTGDVGHLDEDGFLYVAGRKGDMILSGGMRVFPAEIEDVLREHPDVADVAVIGVPHERWGETVCAVVEPVPDATAEERELIAFCTERLAGYKKPTLVRFVGELPRTAGGRPRKGELRERFAEVGESVVP